MIEVEYFSCNIVLEVVELSFQGTTRRRRAILAKLPEELRNDHDAAEQHVLPFVAAVQHLDARAIAEVCRALQAQADRDEEGAYYDPTGFDREEWIPKLLCRVGRCRQPVVSGSTFCTKGPHQVIVEGGCG